MKKLGIGIIALILLVILSLFVIPSFLDSNRYKSYVSSQFEKKTGYKLNLDGSVNLSLFPTPVAKIERVSISNNSKVIVSADELVAYPEIGALFSGKVQINSFEINAAKVNIEKAGESYNYTKHEVNANEATIPNDPNAISIAMNDIKINNSEIVYKDIDGGKTFIADKLNGTASLGSASGPFSFNGEMQFQKKPLKLEIGITHFDKIIPTVKADYAGTKLEYSGGATGGKLSLQSADLSPVFEVLEISQLAHLKGKQASFNGDVKQGDNSYEINSAKFVLGQNSGVMDLNYTMQDDLRLTGKLNFDKLVVDELVPSTSTNTEKSEEQKSVRESIAKKRFVTELEVAAKEFNYKKTKLTDFKVNVSTEDDNIVLNPLEAKTSGNGFVQLAGVFNKDKNGRNFEGTVAISAADLKQAAKDLGAEIKTVTENSLKNLDFNSDLFIAIRKKTKLNFSKASMAMDGSKFDGNIVVTLGDATGVDITGSFDTIDFNKYIAPKSKPDVVSANGAKYVPTKIDFDWLKNFPVKGKSEFTAGTAKYKDQEYAGFKFGGEYQPGKIKVTQFTAASQKLQIAARGSIDVFGARPKFVIETNIGKINTADYLGGNSDSAQSKPVSNGKTRWSEEPFDFEALRQFDGEFRINMASLNHRNLVLDNITTTGVMDSQKVEVREFSSGLFGGSLTLAGSLGITQVPSVSVKFSASNMDLPNIATSLADNERFESGKISISGGIATGGIHQLAMIQNLGGNVQIAGAGVIVKGFDLDTFADQITNINGPEAIIPLARSLSNDSNRTKINAITGNIIGGEGAVKTDNVKMVADRGVGVYDGHADLVNWTMDTRADFDLVMPDDKERPGLGFRIYGDISQPQKDPDYSELVNYFAKRFANSISKRVGIDTNADSQKPLDQIKNEAIKQGVQGILNNVGN